MIKSVYLSHRKKLNFQFQASVFWSHLALDIGLLALNCFLLLQNSYWNLAAAVTLPLFMFRQFSVMHEAVHGSLHPNIKVNNFVGCFAGTFSMLELYQWKKVHIEHHYWAGNIHKDPSMIIVKKFTTFPRPLQKLMSFCWNIGVPSLAFAQHVVFWQNILMRARKVKENQKSFFILIASFLFYATVLLTVPAIGYVSLALGGFVYLYTVEIINFPHHVGLYLPDESYKLPVWEQEEASRSCAYPKLISRNLLLNFNYHSEHHLFPDLPWYYLEEAHQMLLKDNQVQLNLAQHSWAQDKRSLSMQDFLAGVFEKNKPRQPQADDQAA